MESKKKSLIPISKWKKGKHESNHRILSTEKINNKTFAIVDNHDLIKIRQITNFIENNLFCSCIYTMHGQSAIRFIPLTIAAGKDSTIKCYEVDYIRWITKKYNYAMYIKKKKKCRNLLSFLSFYDFRI